MRSLLVVLALAASLSAQRWPITWHFIEDPSAPACAGQQGYPHFLADRATTVPCWWPPCQQVSTVSCAGGSATIVWEGFTPSRPVFLMLTLQPPIAFFPCISVTPEIVLMGMTDPTGLSPITWPVPVWSPPGLPHFGRYRVGWGQACEFDPARSLPGISSYVFTIDMEI